MARTSGGIVKEVQNPLFCEDIVIDGQELP